MRRGSEARSAVYVWVIGPFLTPQRKLRRQLSAPLRAMTMQTTSCSMRPGGYRSFTFRLPAHLPTAHIAVAVSRGCVSLFASNCSRTPRELKLEPAATQRRAPAWWPSKVLMPPLAAWSVTPWAELAHCRYLVSSSCRQAAAACVSVATLVGARVRARVGRCPHPNSNAAFTLPYPG